MSTVTPKVLKFKMIVITPKDSEENKDLSDEDKKIAGKEFLQSVHSIN